MTYLLAYDLGNGKNTFTDVYTSQDLNNNAPYKTSDTVETGYVDISSIENWWWFFEQDRHSWICKDYKYYRNQILILANFVIGWSNLSQREKEISASIFAVGDTERLEVYTVEEQINQGVIHHHRSVKSRTDRLERVQIEIFNRIDKAYWFEIATDLEGIKLHYLQEGREGTLEGDPEGLFDYIDGSNRPGTSWDGNTTGKVGVRDKAFSVVGFNNCSDFADYTLDILKNGNYMPVSHDE